MKRVLVIGMLAWLMVAVAAVVLAGARADEARDAALWRAAGVSRLMVDMAAPPFSLRSLSGDTVELRQLRGQLVLIYFWTTW